MCIVKTPTIYQKNGLKKKKEKKEGRKTKLVTLLLIKNLSLNLKNIIKRNESSNV